MADGFTTASEAIASRRAYERELLSRLYNHLPLSLADKRLARRVRDRRAVFAVRRRRFLARLLQLRELGAPTSVVKHEQLLLWALRYMELRDFTAPPAQLPGWAAAYARHVTLNRPQGSA